MSCHLSKNCLSFVLIQILAKMIEKSLWFRRSFLSPSAYHIISYRGISDHDHMTKLSQLVCDHDRCPHIHYHYCFPSCLCIPYMSPPCPVNFHIFFIYRHFVPFRDVRAYHFVRIPIAYPSSWYLERLRKLSYIATFYPQIATNFTIFHEIITKKG